MKSGTSCETGQALVNDPREASSLGRVDGHPTYEPHVLALDYRQRLRRLRPLKPRVRYKLR